MATQHLLIGTDADGCLKFWPFGRQTQLVRGSETFLSREGIDLNNVINIGRIHENGIACMAHYSLNSSIALVATGGDDGTLALTLIDARDNPSSKVRDHTLPVVISTMRLRGAHAASLSALMFATYEETVSPSSCDQISIHAISSGHDQRLKLWKIDVDITQEVAEAVNVACVVDVFTPVADVSSMALLEVGSKTNTSIVIAGAGLDIRDIEELSKVSTPLIS